jgi:hypothetical protein
MGEKVRWLIKTEREERQEIVPLLLARFEGFNRDLMREAVVPSLSLLTFRTMAGRCTVYRCRYHPLRQIYPHWKISNAPPLVLSLRLSPNYFPKRPLFSAYR